MANSDVITGYDLDFLSGEVNNLLKNSKMTGKAPDFSTGTTYHKYNLVTKSDKMWRCNQDTFQGEWLDSAWNETDLVTELRRIQGSYGDYEALTINVGVNTGTGITAGLILRLVFETGSQSQSEEITVPESGVITRLIPMGDVYRIFLPELAGYTIRPSEVFTASLDARTVRMMYEKLDTGVFVLDDTGGVTDVAQWNPVDNDRAVGIKYTNSALFSGGTGEHDNSIVMAKNSVFERRQYSPDYQTLATSVTNTTNQNLAMVDYNGSANSENYWNEARDNGYPEKYRAGMSLDDYLPALFYARNKTLVFNGTHHGYLPSLGQLLAIKANQGLLNGALEKIGGTIIPNMGSGSWWWSSTEYSAFNMWFLNYGSVVGTYKNFTNSLAVLFDLNLNP